MVRVSPSQAGSDTSLGKNSRILLPAGESAQSRTPEFIHGSQPGDDAVPTGESLAHQPSLRSNWLRPQATRNSKLCKSAASGDVYVTLANEPL